MEIREWTTGLGGYNEYTYVPSYVLGLPFYRCTKPKQSDPRTLFSWQKSAGSCPTIQLLVYPGNKGVSLRIFWEIGKHIKVMLLPQLPQFTNKWWCEVLSLVQEEVKKAAKRLHEEAQAHG